MKVSGPKGRPITRLESIKQAILLFVHSKVTINPDHRFSFASLAQVASWHQKEFSNGVGSAIAALRGLVYTHSPQENADLTQLFRIAAHEAKKSVAQNRLLRVNSIHVLLRSSTIRTQTLSTYLNRSLEG
ncbi:hypothetical protein MKW98_021345 [Papaver atlanticum]|uniref:Uncharacterized protein n=1 Tax=Papaver atlanticum TaxID=357466 RepID=A0AAD4SRL3_9MAGN|nr:hypothetical protein MKW98_021345 [Papaver atlanticum]